MDQFANMLFGYNAGTFRELFQDISAKVEKDEVVAGQHRTIGTDNVNVLIDSKNKTVIFTIAAIK